MLHEFLPRIEFDSYEDFKLNYKVNVPEDFNFGFDIVDKWAEKDFDKPALVWCNDEGEEKRFSFGDMKRLSNKAVNFLKKSGVKKGDPVLLILKRRYEFWILSLAIHKLGAILIPASIQLTAKDIVYRNNAAKIKMIIAVNEPEIIENVEKALPDSPTVKVLALVGDKKGGWLDLANEMEKCPDVFERPAGEEKTYVKDTMLLYFTSGTTGMPKMVRHDFSYPLGHIVTAKYWQQVEDGKLHMTVSDSGWAKFAWGKIYGQWICGAVIFAYDMIKFVPELLLAKIEQYKVFSFCAPPTILRFFIKEDLKKYDLSCIKHCSTAGEPLNPEVFYQFKNATGLEIREGFGQSESSVIVANFPWITPKPGSMGKPSPLYDIALVNEDGEICEEGEEGELVINGVDSSKPVGLFTEYYMDEEVTKKVWHDDAYHTGDVAWFDDEGHFWFIGRADDVIKCSGYRIGPFEVESALQEHPSVLECAVVAAPDPVRGNVVKAVIVLAKGFEPSEQLKKELQEHVKKVTAPYKYPRIIDFVKELPKTTSSKIKRKDLREENK